MKKYLLIALAAVIALVSFLFMNFREEVTSLLSSQVAAVKKSIVSPTLSSAVVGGVPVLHSNPSATAKIYLDFDGEPAGSWNHFSNVPATPAYDIDGNATAFSTAELTNINYIWSRMAEKFSPLNVDITTEDPGTYADRVAMKVVIGGNGLWFQSGSYGGASALGAFYDPSLVNRAYNFSAALSGNPKTIAEQMAFNIGESFGLWKQNSGQNAVSGDTLIASSMSLRGSSGVRGLWWYDSNNDTTNVPQNDLTYLSAGAPNSGYSGLGYRTDDYGNNTAAANVITESGTTTRSGIIGQSNDVDYFRFTTSGGVVTMRVMVPDPQKYGPMLDPVLELRSGSDTLIATADVSYTKTLPVYAGDSITQTLNAGTYYVAIKGHGMINVYDLNNKFIGQGIDVGQYTLTLNVSSTGSPMTPSAPTNVSATSTSPSQINITWSASSGATSYNLYRSTTSGAETLYATNITGTAYQNLNLPSNTRYYYKVAAVNAEGTSPLSAEVSSVTFQSLFSRGDANGDGKVDFQDFVLLSNTYGTTTDQRADFNIDGVVDFKDFIILSNNYGLGT